MSANPSTSVPKKSHHEPLLRVEDLQVDFPIAGSALLNRTRRIIRAVNGVHFDVFAGTTLGIVGESGCGKSTLAKAIVRLIDPTKGRLFFDGTEYTSLSGRALCSIRARIQLIFQDVQGSLNPRRTVGDSIAEPLVILKKPSGEALRSRVKKLLEQVGLTANDAGKFPHELSGGQRQRVGIARALSVEPRLVVCDEPASALDVSIRAQVLNVLIDLQARLGVTYVFISHDLRVVGTMSDRIAVMYRGRIVEMGDTRDVLSHAHHPYTQALLDAVPVPDPSRKSIRSVPASEVERTLPLGGCAYRDRCPIATTRCSSEEPVLTALPFNSQQHLVACHLPNELSLE